MGMNIPVRLQVILSPGWKFNIEPPCADSSSRYLATAAGRGGEASGVWLATPRAEATVGAFRAVSGPGARSLQELLQPPLQGLVLEAYGVGNGPDRDAALLAAVGRGHFPRRGDRGDHPVSAGCSASGRVRGGLALAKAGVISGA